MKNKPTNKMRIISKWILYLFLIGLAPLYSQDSGNSKCSIPGDVACLKKSNLKLDKKIQDAHYLLTGKIHNIEEADFFLEVNPYDVSGNARHGEYVNVSIRKQEGKGLYYQAAPPFYPIYSREKSRTITATFPNGKVYVGNPGKKFNEPDNNLIAFKLDKYGGAKAKSIKLNKMFWDANGNGKREKFDKEEQLVNENKKNEKQLKFPFKSNRNADTYFKFPQPFMKNETGNFTVSFWLNPRTENICSITMPIIDTQFFLIELVNGGLRFTRKVNGVIVANDNLQLTPPSTDSNECHEMLYNKWRFYGLSFQRVDQEKIEITVLHRFKSENPIQLISPIVVTLDKNVIPKKKLISNIPARMMGTGFAGSLYSVRFFNTALNKAALLDLIKTDYKILRRKPDKRTHLNNGFHYKNNLNAKVSNRFQHINGAKEFSEDETIPIKSFLPKKYDATKGYSVSFWTKIVEDPTNDDDIPFDKDGYDMRHQFFYGKTDLDIYAGMQRVKDKLGVNRYYFDDKKQEQSPIFAWLWEPGAFNSKGGCDATTCIATGWYHVVLVYYSSMMRVYLFHPGESDVYRRLLYLGAQNISSVEEWALGAPTFLSDKYPYPVQSAKFLDDFKVYAWPLSLNDVKTLHKTESDELATLRLDQALAASANTEHVTNAALSEGAKGGIAGLVAGSSPIAVGLIYRFGLPRLSSAGRTGELTPLVDKSANQPKPANGVTTAKKCN